MVAVDVHAGTLTLAGADLVDGRDLRDCLPTVHPLGLLSARFANPLPMVYSTPLR